MRRALALFVLAVAAISGNTVQNPSGFADARPRLYELYSWRQSDGIWRFSVVPSPSGVNTPADAVFDKKSVLIGIEKLKLKISELPASSRVLWMDRIASVESSKAPGNTTLAYPPEAVVEQVKRYAQKKHIDVDLVSANPLRS